VSERDPALEAALTKASDESSLPLEYRDCVRPLLRDPDGRWPECCGGNCEPCSLVLVRVGARTLELLGRPRRG
jgi:hypothetical protein